MRGIIFSENPEDFHPIFFNCYGVGKPKLIGNIPHPPSPYGSGPPSPVGKAYAGAESNKKPPPLRKGGCLRMEAGGSADPSFVCVSACRSLSQLKLTAPFSQGSLFFPAPSGVYRNARGVISNAQRISKRFWRYLETPPGYLDPSPYSLLHSEQMCVIMKIWNKRAAKPTSASI